MRREVAFALLVCGALLHRTAAAADNGINPLPLIIRAESSGIPTAHSNASTSSGLAGEVNDTWASALAACGGSCGTTAQFPTAASAPANVQVAATNALINQQGLQPWLCNRCDRTFAAQVAAAGGEGAFQTRGLDTNPDHFAALNTPAGLSSFLAGGGTTPISNTVSTGGIGALSTGGVTQTISGSVPATGGGGTPANVGILDQVVLAFQVATQWQSRLFTIAADLFGLLAIIDLAASLILLVISGDRPNFLDVFLTIVRWLFAVGIFSWLMLKGSGYATDIINSFRQVGTVAGGAAISPTATLASGVNAAGTIWNRFASFFHPVTMTMMMIAVLPIIISYCLMATWMASALIESYFVIGTSSLLLAFGGMRWSRDIAISLLRYCLAAGIQLFALEMIVGIGNTFVQQWTNIPDDPTIQQLLIAIAGAVFLAATAKKIPDTMQRIILGSPQSHAHYTPVGREAVGTAALAAAPVLAAAGFGALAAQAFRESLERLAPAGQQSEGDAGRGGRAVQLALGMGRSVASAAGSEISGRLGGLYRGGAAASAVRMASHIAQSRRVAAAEQARPQVGGLGSQAPEPWMMQRGGLSALSAALRQSAETSYQKWSEDNPRAAAKYGIESYVDYVQNRWAGEGRSRN